MRCCTGHHRCCRAAAAVAGCLLALVAQLATAAGPGVHGRVLELSAEGKIAGTVSGAAIQFQDPSGATAGQTTSGKGGYYRVDLPPGNYYYKITAAGYKDEDHGRGIALQRSEGYAVYNLSLTKGTNDPDRKPPVIDPVQLGKLSGRVLGAGPEESQIGVPWATIVLRRTDGNRELVQVVSGEKDPKAGREAGQYAIALPAGAWQASVSAEGFQTLVDPQPIAIDPAKPATRDFLLARPTPRPVKGQGIKGLITIDDPKLSPETKAAVLSSVEVSILPYWKTAEKETPLSSDAGGNYSRDLLPGRYRVTAVAKGYKPAGRRPVAVFAGKYSVVNLALVPDVEPQPQPLESLVFEGTVYQQADEMGGRRPLPGASVLIRTGDQALSEAPRGTTDSQGKVKLEVARSGEYTLLAQKPGYVPGGARVTIAPGAPNSQTITLSRESPAPKPDVPTEESVTVTGYVVYRDAASSTGYWGVKGTELSWVRPGSRNLPAVAGASGEFKLELAEGMYGVSVVPPAGFVGVNEEVVVRRGMEPKYFILERRKEPPPEPQPERLVHVEGHVMTPSPTSRGYTPVAGARVSWTTRSGHPLAAAISDGSGRFSVDLEKGTYEAVVEPPRGYENTSKPVVVQPGMGRVSLVVQREGRHPPGPGPQPPAPDELTTLIVQVLMAGVPVFAPPLPGAQIDILKDNRIVASSRADLMGNASFKLQPGSYELQARFEGYGSSRQTVTLQGGVSQQTLYLKQSEPAPNAQVAFTVRVVAADSRIQIPGGRPVRRPLSTVVVSIMQNRRIVLTGQTDRTGTFTGRLAPGNYQVKAVYEGFNPNQASLNLARNPVTVEIALTRGGEKIEIPQTPDKPTVPGRVLPGQTFPKLIERIIE